MAGAQSNESIEQLSPWWARAVALTFVFGFGVLILLTFKAYQNAPPIPARAVDASGQTVFTGDDVRLGDHEGGCTGVFRVGDEGQLDAAGQGGLAGVRGKVGEQQEGGGVVAKLLEKARGFPLQPGLVAPPVVELEVGHTRGRGERIAGHALDEGGLPFAGAA